MIAQDGFLVRRLILVLANVLDSLATGELRLASEAPADNRVIRTNGTEATHAEETSSPAADGPEPDRRYGLRDSAKFLKVTEQTIRKWAKGGELGEITYETIQGKQRMMVPGEGIIAKRIMRETSQLTA
jgi:hypothetical protein